MKLLGTFRLSGPDGARVEISSRKGAALIALLATGSEGERTRSWLQDKLWGSRQQQQAQDSLRRELSNLSRQLNTGAAPLLICLRDRIRLDLQQVHVDILDEPSGLGGEFLEGFDLAGEEGFEDWLREQRNASALGHAAAAGPWSPPASRDEPRALAVLPLENLTGDVSVAYLCEGLSEDLIDRLSRLRWLPVIARSSSFAYAADPAAVLERLGARYLVEGRLRRLGEGMALSASLSDLSTARVLWSQRLDLPPDGSPAALDQMVAELTRVLELRIDHAEQARALAKPQSDLNVRDLIWRGRWHLNRLTREDAEKARVLFDEALAREPESPEALIQAAWALGWSIWANRQDDARTLEMRKLAQRAMLADPEDGRGHMLAGIAEIWLRRHTAAETLLRQAVALNPNLAMAYAQLGGLHNWRGRPEQAVAALNEAVRLSPYDTHVFFTSGELAVAHCMLGRWDEAVEHADASIARRPAYWYAHMAKINGLGRGGQPAAAREAYEELRRVKPRFRLGYIEWIPFSDRSWNAFFAEGIAQVSGEELALAETA